MSTRAILVISLTMAALFPIQASAQVTPADTARVLYQVADDLLREGRQDRADQLLRLIRERYPGTEFARLAGELLAARDEEREEGSGNTELVAWSTIYGASLGIMVPAAFGAEEPEPFGVGLLIGGPSGFAISKAWTNANPVTSGQARAMTFGSWWGTWQGVGWQQALDLGDRSIEECFDTGMGVECFTYEESSDEAPFTAMIIGGLAGMGVGTVLGQTRSIASSTALISNFSALWGTWFGTVIGELIREDSRSFSSGEDHTVLTSSLLGGNIGLLAGALGGGSLGWTTGQAWSVHLAGLAGLVAGFGLDLIADVEETETALLIPGVTSGFALALAAATTRADRTASGGGFGLAAITIDQAGVRVGMPTPVPTVIPVRAGDRRRLVPGVRVEALRVSW